MSERDRIRRPTAERVQPLRRFGDAIGLGGVGAAVLRLARLRRRGQHKKPASARCELCK